MTQNRVHPQDDIHVDLYDEGKKIDAYQGSGYHSVEEAVTAAYEGSSRNSLNIEDYVFSVTNLTTGTSARYRVNAGGHLRILPEE